MEKMGKGDFIEAIAEKSGMSKKDVSAVYESMVEVITDAMKAKKKISLVGFGTYEISHRAARKGVNPSNGEQIDIPAKDVPKFSFSSAIKNVVNE